MPALRSKKLALTVIFVVALGLRLGHVLLLEDRMYFDDARTYCIVAKNLLDGRGLILDDDHRVTRAPFYPVVLASLFKVFGEGVLAPRLLHCVLGAATCVLVALLAESYFGGATSYVAGAICAVYPFFVFYTGLLLTETLFIFVLVSHVLAVRAQFSRPGVWNAIAVGATLGAGVLTRPSLLTFLPLPCAWLVAFGSERRRQVVGVAVAIASFGVVMCPWVVRNYRVVGKLVPTTLLVGKSLYEANSPYATGGPAMHITEWPREIEGLSEYDRDRVLKHAAVRYIRQNPQRFLFLCVVRFARFWNLFPNYDVYRSTLYCVVSACSYGPVLVLALLALRPLLPRWREVGLLLLPVLYFAALHLVFVSSIRYRTPVMPFLIVLAAYALVCTSFRIGGLSWLKT